jgi:DNA-binding LytR/AlgR family response regulator
MNMSYKAVITDDEAELRTYLRSILADTWPGLEICGEAANGREALNLVEAERPQVVFLDIRMPGLSGLQIASKIAAICRVVFVTAYDQYAVEAFEREAADYLVKPVSRDRMMQTVERLQKQLTASIAPQASLAALVEQVLASLNAKRTHEFLHWIRVQVKDRMRLIPVEDVDFFKAEDKYTRVLTRDGEALIKTSIKSLARQLDPDRFWQIHRSIIVNVARIDQVSRSITGRGLLKIKSRSELLTVSRNYLYLFRQM